MLLCGGTSFKCETVYQEHGKSLRWSQRMSLFLKDHERATRVHLKSFWHKTTVRRYTFQSCHAVSLVLGLLAKNNCDMFVKGLKLTIAFEVWKDNCMIFDKAANDVFCVKGTINGCHRTASILMSDKPTSMKFGDMKTRKSCRKKKITDEKYALVRGNAIFICMNKGWRSCYHFKQNTTVNAIEATLIENLFEKLPKLKN